MTHVMIALWRPPDTPIERYRDLLLTQLAPRLLAEGPNHLTVNVADLKAPSLNARRSADQARVSSLIEATTESTEAALQLVHILDPDGQMSAAYQVHQAIPRDYTRHWPDGQPSPGARQITFLRRRRDLTHEAFTNHWFNTHTPLALAVHPIWRYSRNAVHQPLTPNAPDYDGIVGLHFCDLLDITDPMRLFGGKPQHIQTITDDVTAFIDMPSIVVTAMTEHVLKTQPNLTT